MKKRGLTAISMLLVLTLIMTPFTGAFSTSAEAKASKTVTVEEPDKPAISLKAGKNNGQITVSIQKNKNTTGYYVYLKEKGAKKYKQVKELKQTGSAARTCSINGLKPGTTYYVKVKAYNKSGKVCIVSETSEAAKLKLKKVNTSKSGTTTFTYFIAMSGSEINTDNDIYEAIGKKWGVKVNERWLSGQSSSEAVGSIMHSGNYPDYIYSDCMNELVEADALIPLDDYIDQYYEFRDTWYTTEEWNKFRQPDGHIYWIDLFSNTFGKPTTTTHNDLAFWMQARVLEWANYPEIKTLDDYFNTIEAYIKANPKFTDPKGNVYKNIGYTALCEDWRYFCIESAGQFLAGYPNDGSVIVNKTTMKIEDYNTSKDTKLYLKKLNEEYKKGILDKDFATQTYDQYISKLLTGSVLGMCDQWWDFAYSVESYFNANGYDELGCNYVPFGLTTKGDGINRYHEYADTLNRSSGIGITKDCSDPDKAFWFIVQCAMDQELHDLRFWGEKNVDYSVDADGLYYRTEEQFNRSCQESYKASHLCSYSYFPQWTGTSRDGINAMQPQDQPSEFQRYMAEPLKKVFKAYKANNYVDMLGSVIEDEAPWFPMYAYSNGFTGETAGGKAYALMGEVKHTWIPKVVTAKNFNTAYNNYLKAYKKCKPQDFLKEMQEILDTFK